MYEFTVLMALTDYIPVAIFAVVAVLLMRDLYSKMPKYAFVLCFLCYMAMGYLASRDGSSAAMNWAEQGVNCLGQVFLLIGVLTLHKAGLREFEL